MGDRLEKVNTHQENLQEKQKQRKKGKTKKPKAGRKRKKG